MKCLIRVLTNISLYLVNYSYSQSMLYILTMFLDSVLTEQCYISYISILLCENFLPKIISFTCTAAHVVFIFILCFYHYILK